MTNAKYAAPGARPRMLTAQLQSRRPAVILFGLFGAAVVAAMGTGCGGGPDSLALEDGTGTVTQEHSVGDAAPPQQMQTVACAVAAEGCPCDHDGDAVTCVGPKIQTGNYTSCEPGKRTCAAGAWGPCVGKTVYENADTLTEDYASPCQPATAVRWGTIALQGHTPDGSNIEVLVQTASSQSSLDDASMVRVTAFGGSTNSTWTSPDVDAALMASGQTPAAWLRITLSVTASPGGSMPQVVAWGQATSCVPPS